MGTPVPGAPVQDFKSALGLLVLFERQSSHSVFISVMTRYFLLQIGLVGFLLRLLRSRR